MAMVGFTVLAFIAVAHVGGVDAMQAQVAANFGGGEQAFRFLPDFRAAERAYLNAEREHTPIDLAVVMRHQL